MDMRGWIRHHLNPLHVYCRLRDLGMDRKRARDWARWWERVIRRAGWEKITNKQGGRK